MPNFKIRVEPHAGTVARTFHLVQSSGSLALLGATDGDIALSTSEGSIYRLDASGWTTVYTPGTATVVPESIDGLEAFVEAFLVDNFASEADLVYVDTQLGLKSNTGHTHVKVDITDFAHTHPESDVTGLVSDLAGKASLSHTHAAGDIASGTLLPARLGSGSGGATKFLREDSTWQAVAGGAPAWGDVTGTLSNQTDLQTALDAKVSSPVANGNLANMTTKTYKGRTQASTGSPEDVPVATLKTDLALAKADVGLGSVDNTSDAGKPVSTAQQTALNLKANLASPTFTGTVTVPGITINDATDLTVSATTGTKIGQATSKLGFYGVTPAVRPGALTQTYSTTSTTHAAVTSLAAPAGGVGTAAGGWSTSANRDLAITSINAIRTDITNLKNFVNSVVDQLQAIGLLQ